MSAGWLGGRGGGRRGRQEVGRGGEGEEGEGGLDAAEVVGKCEGIGGVEQFE